jgi:hypothetical protein
MSEILDIREAAEYNGLHIKYNIYYTILEEIEKNKKRLSKHPRREVLEQAKSLLTEFATLYAYNYRRDERAETDWYTRTHMHHFDCCFFVFEKALKQKKYILALHELKDVLYHMKAGHDLVYSNLKHVFNKYLNTNIGQGELKMIINEKPYHPHDCDNTYRAKAINVSEFDAQTCLKNILKRLEEFSQFDHPVKDVIRLHDFFITVLREEFRIGQFGTFLRTGKDNKDNLGKIFPHKYYINNAERNVVTEAYTGDVLRVKDTCLVSCIWDTEKTQQAYADVKNNGFNFDDENHRCTYYPEINMCVVYNGFHHTAMASLLHTGLIKPNETCRLEQVYDYVQTDGTDWIDINTKEIICKVFDFRIAAIYELSRRKYEIENSIKGEVTSDDAHLWDLTANILGITEDDYTGEVKRCEFSAQQLSDILCLRNDYNAVDIDTPEESLSVNEFFDVAKIAEMIGAQSVFTGFLSSKKNGEVRLVVDGIKIKSDLESAWLLRNFALTFRHADTFIIDENELFALYE